MNLNEQIARAVVKKMEQEGSLSADGLIELEKILTGPVERVEDDLLYLIKREYGIDTAAEQKIDVVSSFLEVEMLNASPTKRRQEAKRIIRGFKRKVHIITGYYDGRVHYA